jgi:hypothetical protein
MKEIILKVPDQKLNFFMDLVRMLGFEVVKEKEVDVSEEHKEIVRQRIKESEKNPDRLLDWDNIEDKFNLS